jgi:hypothetical protein
MSAVCCLGFSVVSTKIHLADRKNVMEECNVSICMAKVQIFFTTVTNSTVPKQYTSLCTIKQMATTQCSTGKKHCIHGQYEQPTCTDGVSMLQSSAFSGLRVAKTKLREFLGPTTGPSVEPRVSSAILANAF